jgi:hypothetical protein
MLRDIMFGGQYARLHDPLIQMGYSLDSTDFEIDEDLLTASLEAFRAEHKDDRVPLDFVVPHHLSRYPKETWGYKLGVYFSLPLLICVDISKGEVVHCIETFGSTSKYAELLVNPDHNAALTRLTRVMAGRTFSASNTALVTGPMVLEAMRTYKEIYGISRVRERFVVPIDDLRYPKEVRGILLGEKIRAFTADDRSSVLFCFHR